MRVTRTIDATEDELEEAKLTITALVGDSSSQETLNLFYTNDLSEIEAGIRRLNDFSSKCWLLSSILLYTLIFNQNLYSQSGLDWFHYSRQARERLGLDNREITEQLGAARFFIKYHKALQKKGFTPEGANRKLARAELALKLSGNSEQVIDHLVKDTFKEFFDWYSSFKKKEIPLQTKNADYSVIDDRFYFRDSEAVTIAESLPDSEKNTLKKYIGEIFKALQNGDKIAVVSVYDEKEARLLPTLLNRHREGR